MAVAHSILVICWHLITNDTDYEELGGDYFTHRNDPTATATSSNNSTASATTSPCR